MLAKDRLLLPVFLPMLVVFLTCVALSWLGIDPGRSPLSINRSNKGEGETFYALAPQDSLEEFGIALLKLR